MFLCLVWAAAESSAAWRFSEKIPALVGAAIIIACVVATRQQVRYWRDNFTMANHALEVTTKNQVAQDLIGEVLVEQGRYEQAAEHFRAALAADPGLWFGTV